MQSFYKLAEKQCTEGGILFAKVLIQAEQLIRVAIELVEKNVIDEFKQKISCSKTLKIQEFINYKQQIKMNRKAYSAQMKTLMGNYVHSLELESINETALKESETISTQIGSIKEFLSQQFSQSMYEAISKLEYWSANLLALLANIPIENTNVVAPKGFIY
jgi:hypothetical protein